MKGGPSVAVLLELALGDRVSIARQAAKVLKTQVFVYETDTDRLKATYDAGSEIAKDILNSSAFTKYLSLPDIDNEIEVVTHIAVLR